VGRDPQAARGDDGGEAERRDRGDVLVQHDRRPLRGLSGRGHRDDRHAVPRRRGSGLRQVRRPALRATLSPRSGARGNERSAARSASSMRGSTTSRASPPRSRSGSSSR
jgi:hypothetical protein